MNIVLAIQEGSHAVFRLVYEQWYERAYFYFLKKVKSEDLARELVQQTFIKVWSSRHTLSLEYNFESHLFMIARCVWIDDLRKRAVLRKIASGDVVETASVVCEKHTDFETKNELQTLLHRLPPARRKVFELSRVEGYSYKEIAQMLKISVKTVDNHLVQAIRQLKSMFFILFLLALGLMS